MTLVDTVINTVPLPDLIYRQAIRYQLAQRLKIETSRHSSAHHAEYIQQLKDSPLVVHAKDANEQHYEVPTEFYELVLGSYKKYSSCLWTDTTYSLDDAECAMLDLVVNRAQLKDGQTVLDLGCGWGSLSLYLAARFPTMSITAVSNSATQKAYIDEVAQSKNLSNIKVITSNVDQLTLDTQFDRVVSVEMFEHVRNYQQLFNSVSDWLMPDGLCFVHVFGHRELAYLFDDQDQSSWMATYFFTGGQMPSRSLFSEFDEHLQIQDEWVVNGEHYYKTCMAWLANMDSNRAQIMPIFKQCYGKKAKQFWIYWRLFFMACAELFHYNQGEEWQVYHYLFRKAS